MAQDTLNYNHVTYDFDPSKGKTDEATAYYIKLFAVCHPTFMSGILRAQEEVDFRPIDFENVNLAMTFDGETMFSQALKSGFLHQVHAILKEIQPLKIPRDYAFDILRMEDPEVKSRLHAIMAYWYAPSDKHITTKADIYEKDLKSRISALLVEILPQDFNEKTYELARDKKVPSSLFGQLIKKNEFGKALEILKGYEGQYYPVEKLVRDLNLTDPQVSDKLRETSSLYTKSTIFKQLNGALQRVLPAYEYKKYVLQKVDYQTEAEHREDTLLERKAQENKAPETPNMGPLFAWKTGRGGK